MNEDQTKRFDLRIQEPLVCVYDYLLQQHEKQTSAFRRQANATYRVHVIIQKKHCRLFPTSLPKITAADDSSQESYGNRSITSVLYPNKDRRILFFALGQSEALILKPAEFTRP